MVNNKMIVTFMLIAVATLAGAGCSDDNPVTLTNPIDTAPLDMPANLSVELSKGSAILDWDPTIDVHVIGYYLTRERNGNTEILGNVTLEYSGYVDSNPLSGSSIYYVYAVDNAGRMSAAATAYLTNPLFRQQCRMSE